MKFDFNILKIENIQTRRLVLPPQNLLLGLVLSFWGGNAETLGSHLCDVKQFLKTFCSVWISMLFGLSFFVFHLFRLPCSFIKNRQNNIPHECIRAHSCTLLNIRLPA